VSREENDEENASRSRQTQTEDAEADHMEGTRRHRLDDAFNLTAGEQFQVAADTGEGAKGPRWYDWCWRPLADPVDPAWRRWLLVRRSISEPAELRAYVVFAPQVTTLEEVVRVAGARWTIESSFEAAKGEVSLDDYEVRNWTGWYRHITLARWAYALLTVRRAGALAVEALKKSLPSPQTGSSLAAFKAGRGLASR
jgi:hypothetical protein